MAEPATAGTEAHYNPIFERLIECSDHDELAGLVESLSIFVEGTKMSWRKFFEDVGLSLLGAFFYTVLLILLVLVLRYAGVDLIDIWQATRR